MVPHIILASGWIVYCVLHSVLASSTVKEAISKSTGRSFVYYRLYYTLFAVFGFVPLIYFLITIRSPKLFQPVFAFTIAGGVIAGIGLLVMSVCIYKYFFQLSGLKSLILERKSDQLMMTGIHRVVRHPLYAGTFIFIWGLLIVFPTVSLLITDVIITIYTLIGIRFEEKKLEKEFGSAYREYKRTVPMLIPGSRSSH